MEYKIIKTEYTDLSRKCILAEVESYEKDKEGNNIFIEKFFYNITADDDVPLGRLLYEKLANNLDNIPDSEEIQIIKKKKPLPKDKLLFGNLLISRSDYINNLENFVNIQLDELYSSRALILAERYPKFAKKRKKIVDDFFDIATQPGYPFDIDWPEFLPLQPIGEKISDEDS